MKTIKDAVIELGGKLPNRTYTKYSNAAGWYISATGKLTHAADCVWLEPEEFESEAKRLGYISGYRWGIEYPTNGERPDLADGVLIDIKTGLSNAWLGWTDMKVVDTAWTSADNNYPATHFKVIDERYKPADTSYLNQCKYSGVSDVDQLKVKCMHLIDDKPVGDDGLEIIEKYLSKPDDSLSGRAVMANEMSKLGRKAAAELADDVDNAIRESVRELISDPSNQLATNWHERGELPPVGVDFESYFAKDTEPNWDKGRVAYSSSEHTILVFDDGKENYYETENLMKIAKFRPIRTEREKVIEAALDAAIENDGIPLSVVPHINQILERIYDAGMLVLPPKKSDTED